MKKFTTTLLIIIGLIISFSCKQSGRKTESQATGKTFVYIGTYTDTESEGIYRYTLNQKTGELTDLQMVAQLENPSYLTISGKTLFAVTEQQSGSQAISYLIGNDGLLNPVSSATISGVHPCFVEFSDTLNTLLVANYTSGSLSIFEAQIDGRIIPNETVIQHEGSGPQTDRQEGPHAHSITIAPNNKTAYAADLGADRVFLYNLEDLNAPLAPIVVSPGAGPRHIAFHPKGEVMALLNELNNTVSIYSPNENGLYTNEVQTINMLPSDFKEFSKAADIHFTTDGQYLFASNRGHNSLVAFKFDSESQTLQLLDWTPTEGETPRNFMILNDLLLVANQDTNNIAVFKIEKNGSLRLLSKQEGPAKPVCLKSISM